MRTENKMNEISSTECAVEAHAVRLIICTNTFFCSRRIRYAYAVATIKWKIFRRTAIRFSVNAVVLINAIDLICMWIIPRFFISFRSAATWIQRTHSRQHVFALTSELQYDRVHHPRWAHDFVSNARFVEQFIRLD